MRRKRVCAVALLERGGLGWQKRLRKKRSRGSVGHPSTLPFRQACSKGDRLAHSRLKVGLERPGGGGLSQSNKRTVTVRRPVDSGETARAGGATRRAAAAATRPRLGRTELRISRRVGGI